MASPDNAVISTVGSSIIDASGNAWTIANTGQVAQNGTVIGTTSTVVRLAYVGSVLWHENLAGSWFSWNGTAFVGPAAAGSPLPASVQTNFYVSNGKIYDPSGNEFLGRGINITDYQLTTACTGNTATPLLTLFPGLNLIRVPVTSYWDPSSYATVISQLTLNGIVVELEHHPFPIPNAYTGTDLSTETAWYTKVATYFKNNPRVWLGSMNEPQYYGAGGIGDVTSQHVATYTAIRNAGFNGPIMLCFPAGGNPGTVGTGGGMKALPYSTLKNIIWDEHFYPWMTNNIEGNYSTSATDLANLVAGSASGGYGIAAAATITSADGVIPLIWGETGPSEDGTNTHPNSTQVVDAVCKSGKGFTAWAWQPDTANALTDGVKAITTYGTQVAGLIALAQKNAGGSTGGGSSGGGSSPVTIITPTSGGSVSDAAGNVWTLDAGGNLIENGTAVAGGQGTEGLAVVNGVVWAQDKSSGTWYTYVNGTFTSQGTATPGPSASANNYVYNYVGQTPLLYDASGEAFSLSGSGANHFSVVVNGVTDTTSSTVTFLLYYNGQVYKLEANGSWYSKTKASDAWAGPGVDPRTATGTGTRVAAPLTGPVTAGTWSTNLKITVAAMPNGYMRYNLLLPSGYSATGNIIYPVLFYGHQNGEGTPNGTYPADGAGLVNQTVIDGTFNTVAFRTNFPCIVVVPECDQSLDTSGGNANANFGGYADKPNSGGNEQAINAIAAYILANYKADKTRFYATGDSLGAIGTLAWMIDNNQINGVNKIWTAGMGFSDQLYRPTVPNSVAFASMKTVPYIAISTPNDNWTQGGPNYDDDCWASYTGNTTYPTPANYTSGGVASIRAGTTNYYYIRTTTGVPWDTYRQLNADGGQGTALYTLLFSYISADAGVTTQPASGTRHYWELPGGPNCVWNTPLGDQCKWGLATDADTIDARHGGIINADFSNLGSGVWLSQSTADPIVSFSGKVGNYNQPGQYNGSGTPLTITAHCVKGSYTAGPYGSYGSQGGWGDGQYNFYDTNGNSGRMLEAGFELGAGNPPTPSLPIGTVSSYSGIPYVTVEDATANDFGEDWETGIGVGCQGVGMITGWDLDATKNPNLIPGVTGANGKSLTKMQHVLRYAHDAQWLKSNTAPNADGTNGNGFLKGSSWPQLYQDYQDLNNLSFNYYRGNLIYGTLLGIPSTTTMPATNPQTGKAWTDAGKQIWWTFSHYGSIGRDQAGGGFHLSVDAKSVPASWITDAQTDLAAIVQFLCPLRNQRVGDQDVSATNAKNGPGNRLDSGPPPLATLSPAVGYTPSVNNTVATGPNGGSITDLQGVVWSITSTNQVAVNGVTDTGTANIAQLAYVRRQIWQKTTSGTWYVKTFTTDNWTLGSNPIPTTITPISALNQVPTPIVSPDRTTVPPSASIIDTNNHVWTITANKQVAVDGTTDTTTANVVELAYVGGKIWQENSTNYWQYKVLPTDAWLPTGGTTTSPLVIPVSPDNTIVPPATSITDANGHVWTITASAVVAVDGVAGTDSSNVVKLAYEGGKVWQENSAGLWWSKTLPTDTWLPTNGTTVSPIPTGPTFTESASGTVLGTAGAAASITNSTGEVFTFVASNNGQVAQNGTADPATTNVTQVLYYNHLVYYKNTAGNWFYKGNIASVYTGPVGDPTKPAFIESPQEAVVTYIGQTPVITNGNGDTFTLTGTTLGQFQILQNGVVDPNVAASVNFLEYFNHLIYYQDSAFNWHYKSKATDSYAPSPTGDPRNFGFSDTVITSDALTVTQTPFTESTQNTVISYVGQTPPIYDRIGETFALTGGPVGSFQILQNGVVDPNVSATVRQLVYYNQLVYYQNFNFNWYYKPNIAAAYLGPISDPRFTAFTGSLTDTGITSDTLANVPTPFTESSQNTLLTLPSQSPIYDRLGEYFSLAGTTAGQYQIVQNGAVDTSVPATVKSLLYYNHLVYYQNAALAWFSKPNIAVSYTAAPGDPHAVPASSLSDTVITLDGLIVTQTPFTESAQGTVVSNPSQPLIYDRLGETFGLTGTGSGYYQILQNGVVDSTISPSIIKLIYYNGLVYYENNISNWYSKPNIAGVYTKSTTGDPTSVSPTPFVLSDTILTSDTLAVVQTPFTESAPKTRITAPGQPPIYNRLGETFALSGSGPGFYQILQNGTADPYVPATVRQLVYYNQLVYYQDSSLTWYDKASISGSYVTSPTGDPTLSVFPQALNDTILITDQLVLVSAPVDVSLPDPAYTAPALAPRVATAAAVVVPVQVQPSAPVTATATAATNTGQQTLLLDTNRWDLVLDANGNIAVASPPYAVAQDAASAVRLFQGELWYDTAPGVPYFQGILGQQPPAGVTKAAINAAAMSVPDVSASKTYISSTSNRAVTGQVQILTSEGINVQLTGVLQTSPVTDKSGNPLVDSNGNIIFTVQ